jgi:hypothetical protein
LIRPSRFGLGYAPALVQQAAMESSRTEIFTPTRGLHRGDSAEDLRAGYTPDASNFMWDAGYLRPRSGLSRFKGGISQLSGAALGAWRMWDTSSNQYLIAASADTIAYFDPGDDAWSALSYVSSGSTSLPSGSSRAYWDAAHIYDPQLDRKIAVLTNYVDLPMSFRLERSIGTYSNLTDFASLASRAYAVCAFDNRLVWFNIATSSASFPTQVLWSARGRPRNYQLADGAGAEDLNDMQGYGTRVVPEADGVLLFSTEEIWRGRKRGDAYVFDFYPLQRQFGGPFPRTICRTPIGTVFVGRDLEIYVVRGDAVVPIGPETDGEPSRVQGFLTDEVFDTDRMWACYNPAKQRYELYYTGSDSLDGFPTRALYYSVLDRSFLPQSFPVELSAGVEYTDPGVPLSFDGSALAWDAVLTSFNEQFVPGTGFYVTPFSSNGTGYWFSSTATNDDGSRITAYWTSHALNREDQMRYECLSELWTEYRADSVSSMSIIFSANLDFTDTQVVNLALASGNGKRAHASGDVTGVSPYFRMQITDGGRPSIARFQAQLIDAGLYDGDL